MKKIFFSLVMIANLLSATGQVNYSQKIAIIGTGYVGLVSGCCLADMGHIVTCLDIDEKKINRLNMGIMPIYEPNLESKIARNRDLGLLSFSADVAQGIQEAQVVIVAVGTPMNDQGAADLTSLRGALNTIGQNLNTYKVICIKSTVPIGTNEIVKQELSILSNHENFDVVSNPEFLREGSAIDDFFTKNPVVLGSDSSIALDLMETIYKPLQESGRLIIKTNFTTAELIKYAWNVFSAIKITYVNELSHICSQVGADIADLIKGMSGSDDLLPIKNIKPGPGLGGSCLPKDTRAFAAIAQAMGIDLAILDATIKADSKHKFWLLKEINTLLNDEPQGKVVALWGLSFKANTDDVRALNAHDYTDIRLSPAMFLIKELLATRSNCSRI